MKFLACGNVPYAAHMLLNMNENCAQDGLVVLISQNLAGARMNQIITLCLGLDRLYAVFRPMQVHNSVSINLFVNP